MNLWQNWIENIMLEKKCDYEKAKKIMSKELAKIDKANKKRKKADEQ